MNKQEILDKVKLILIEEFNKEKDRIDNKITELQQIETIEDVLSKCRTYQVACPSEYGLEDMVDCGGCNKCWEIAIQKENVKIG